MNRFLLYSFIFLLLISCSSNDDVAVRVNMKEDTISVGEVCYVELTLPFNDSILPSYYIVEECDTFRLEVDMKRQYGIFRAMGRSRGEKKYKGFVEYYDSNEKKATKYFTIEFFVE